MLVVFFSTTYDAWKAFNGTNSSSTDVWSTKENVPTGWLQLDLGEQKYVNKMVLTSRNDSATGATSPPKDFKILASNDGTNFDIIAEFSNQTNWSPNEKKRARYK